MLASRNALVYHKYVTLVKSCKVKLKGPRGLRSSPNGRLHFSSQRDITDSSLNFQTVHPTAPPPEPLKLNFTDDGSYRLEEVSFLAFMTLCLKL